MTADRPIVLDCTFRDGGYYNEWDFAASTVSAYMQAMASSRVDVIEIGFRQFPQPRFAGALAFSTDKYLRRLNLPHGVPLAVMVNAKDLIAKRDPRYAVHQLFDEATASPVSLVRIAAHPGDVPNCESIAAELRQLGYRVALNIMQASLLDDAALERAAGIVDSWGHVDVLYLADSIGNMQPPDVVRAITTVRRAWSGPIGMHAHNNKGLAVQNALAAHEAGATWLDGTVAGMGRGAGNARTEYLLLELSHRGLGDYYADGMFGLVMEHFEPLRVKYGWGENLLYYLSGTYGIHPTYVQEMLGDGRYETDRIISALDTLRKTGGTSFSAGQLAEAMSGATSTGEGTWSARNWASGRRVVLVAPGPRGEEHLDAVCDLIERESALVVCLNVNRRFPVDKVDAYAACHRTRLALDAHKYASLGRPLIAPAANLAPEVRNSIAGVSILDYGLRVCPDTFSVSDTGCVLPVPLVAPYVMALAEAGGATGLLLVGFDGYDDPNDPRRLEMEHALRCYQRRASALPLVAITPSTYGLPQASVYAPLI